MVKTKRHLRTLKQKQKRDKIRRHTRKDKEGGGLEDALFGAISFNPPPPRRKMTAAEIEAKKKEEKNEDERQRINSEEEARETAAKKAYRNENPTFFNRLLGKKKKNIPSTNFSKMRNYTKTNKSKVSSFMPKTTQKPTPYIVDPTQTNRPQINVKPSAASFFTNIPKINVPKKYTYANLLAANRLKRSKRPTGYEGYEENVIDPPGFGAKHQIKGLAQTIRYYNNDQNDSHLENESDNENENVIDPPGWRPQHQLGQQYQRGQQRQWGQNGQAFSDAIKRKQPQLKGLAQTIRYYNDDDNDSHLENESDNENDREPTRRRGFGGPPMSQVMKRYT